MPASQDESGANEDLKAKMREALDRKKSGQSGGKGSAGADGGPVKEKAHGSEVTGGTGSPFNPIATF